MKKIEQTESTDTQENETQSSISKPTGVDCLKKLQAEIKKRLPKCRDSGIVAIEKTQAALCNAIRIGWLVRDVMQQLKGDATITFEDWMDANFKDEWSVASAKRLAKISKDFHIDLEYEAMRERFGLDPLLVEAVSENSLEKQLQQEARKSSYTSILRGAGILPGKAEAKPKTRAEKSAEQKVVDSVSRALDKYLKLKTERSIDTWEGDLINVLMEKFLIFRNEYEVLLAARPDAINADLQIVKYGEEEGDAVA